MKKRKLLLIGLLIWNVSSVLGQSCGTPHPVNPKIYPQEDTSRSSSSALCINIFFHIVRNTNGTNAFTTPNLGAIVNDLNEFYSPYNIIINNTGSDFINNSNFVNIDNDTEARNLGQTNNRNDAINYYIVNELWDVRDNNGNVIGFVSGTANNIPSNNLVIRNDRTLTSTSPHELGHCLNLLHTHETARGIENISGSNCATSGDLICDTPADPRLGTNNVNANCQYFGGNGYNPLTNNIMSYSRGHCRDEFTSGQGFRIRKAIQNEPVLQNIVSNACTTISEVNNVCYSQTKNIFLTNVGGATTTWSSSSNIQILSSSNINAQIRATNSNSTGNGWIKATLNNGIILQEDFKVGLPSSNNLGISTTGNGIYLFSKTWQELFALGGNNIEWKILGTSTMTKNCENGCILVYPTSINHGQIITIGIRAKNECGYSDWYYKDFTIYKKTSDGGIGIMH